MLGAQASCLQACLSKLTDFDAHATLKKLEAVVRAHALMQAGCLRSQQGGTTNHYRL
jgi:hypothetical protein